MRRFIGIEIGGTKLQVVSGDEQGAIYRRERFRVDHNEGAEGIRRNIAATLASWQDLSHEGIVVGFGGPVDIEANVICKSYHVSGWTGFSLAEWLRELSGLPVLLENDANTAAMGEAFFGAGRNHRVVFYVTLGSGVGGGLVINKKLYHGAVKGEAEFGHLRLDRSGRILESSCSGWSVDLKIREAVNKNPAGILASLVKNVTGGEAKFLVDALEHNDADALKIFNDTTDDLAFGLSHAVQLFHPDIILLGGGLSLMGEILRKTVEQKLSPWLMDNFQPGPLVRLAELKEDAVPAGCLAIASNSFNTTTDTTTVPDMRHYTADYVKRQQQALQSIPLNKVNEVISVFKRALDEDRQIFVFGNGGSAANASHFVTDLGKSSSDKMYKRFKCMALNDNISWITALGNDYAYDEIFAKQLINFAKPGDIVLALSVSGNSPNVVKAVKWASANGLFTIALVGHPPSQLDEMADLVIKVGDTHYGRVEDVQMNICHMICYAFIENRSLQIP